MSFSQSRRASLGIGSTPKLNRRLELRKLFDEIDTDRNGALSVAELHAEITRNAPLHDFFAAVYAKEEELFAAMDTNGDGVITWEEFMVGRCSLSYRSTFSMTTCQQPAATSPATILPHNHVAASSRARSSSMTSRLTPWEALQSQVATLGGTSAGVWSSQARTAPWTCRCESSR